MESFFSAKSWDTKVNQAKIDCTCGAANYSSFYSHFYYFPDNEVIWISIAFVSIKTLYYNVMNPTNIKASLDLNPRNLMTLKCMHNVLVSQHYWVGLDFMEWCIVGSGIDPIVVLGYNPKLRVWDKWRGKWCYYDTLL